MSIAHRALVLRRGLSDRAPSVRNASVEMLKRWLEAFDGDVVKLLVALDVRQTKKAELAVKELIDIGRVKPMETCKSAEAVAKGLKRDFNAEGLLTSEEALYWRMILQHLAASAAKGSDSAHAVGQAREIAVAEVGEMIEAMESAFPSTATDLLRIVNAHAAEADFKFAARQLLRCSSASTSTTVPFDEAPSLSSPSSFDSNPPSTPTARPTRAAAMESGRARSWTLRASSPTIPPNLPVWCSTPRILFACPAPGVSHAGALHRGIIARTHDETFTIRRRRCGDGSSHQTGGDARVHRRSTRIHARARSSGHLAGRRERGCGGHPAHGVECRRRTGSMYGGASARRRCASSRTRRVGRTPRPRRSRRRATRREAFNASLPLEQAFMKCLDEEGKPFHFKADAYDIEDVDVEDVAATKAAAGVEAEESVGTVAAESLCKIILRRGEGAFEAAAGVVARLLGSYFAADAQRRPRLAQCLAVFFPALASAPENRRRLLADCALPALRARK